MTNSLRPSVGRWTVLWAVFQMALSKTRMKDGRMVTQQITPSRTPLAMTTPMSRPKVKLMKQRAMKPAMVVREEPVTEVMVAAMA